MKIMLYPISRTENIVIQEIGREVLIYDLTINKVFCLNQTSIAVWNACDGDQTVVEIAQSLNMPEDAVWLALDQLKDEQLIENYKGSSGYFQGLTRREIIRRVGLTSMVALPFVTSIVAPKAVNAQSIDKCALESPGDFSDGCPCQNNPDCVSGCCSPAIICIGNNCAPDPNHRVCSPIIACR